MTCKRCSYILYGSENYCPHCGERRLPEPSEAKEEQKEPPIFKTQETYSDLNTKSRIFEPEPPAEEEPERAKTKPEKEKKPRGKIAATFFVFSLTFLLAFGIGFAADYFDIIPAVSSLLSPETTAGGEEREFSAFLGTIEPELNFTPSARTVSSPKGLALRKGPSDAFAQIEQLKSGSEVEVIGGSIITEDWVYVYTSSEDLYGWVKAAYIS